ncbi:MAG: hypothetical protein IKK52_00435 [Alphaproteobacteria bacterium]|nr:hypothetical protein [Alphaproteobacteria bacterium]
MKKISISGCRRPMRFAVFSDGFKVYKVTEEQAARFVKDELPALMGNPLLKTVKKM